MTGYKTNTGAAMFAVGGVLVSMAGGCPLPDWVYWIDMAGKILMALGGALGVYGIGDKIDRGNIAATKDRQQKVDEGGS